MVTFILLNFSIISTSLCKLESVTKSAVVTAIEIDFLFKKKKKHVYVYNYNNILLL